METENHLFRREKISKKTQVLIVLWAILLLSRQGFARSTWHEGVRAETCADSDGQRGPILDQFQEQDSGGAHFWADRYVAQTFKPSMSARLHHVDLHIDAWDSQPFYPATISIVETVGGEPSGNVLGSVNLASLQMGWYSVDFLSEAVVLAAEVEYGIVLANDDPDPDLVPTDGVAVKWQGNLYSRGTLWQWTPDVGWEVHSPFGPPGDADVAFRTWMVPEPSTWVLLATGLGAAVAYLWRKRRRR